MTRAESYAQGFSEGWRWAESDIADHAGAWWEPEVLADARRSGPMQAYYLGAARGYRGAFAAFDAGRLAQEEFYAMRLARVEVRDGN